MAEKGGGYSYHTWFYDLAGGRTEYVVTIACMIGKSRMKGEKVVTTLVPYGPEKPRAGMQRAAGTDQVELFWDPPKGDFTRYTLRIDRLERLVAQQGSVTEAGGGVAKGQSLLRLTSLASSQVPVKSRPHNGPAGKTAHFGESDFVTFISKAGGLPECC